MKKNIIIFVLSFLYYQAFSQNMGDETTTDSISFEAAYGYIRIDSSSECIWQIGQPSKPVFDNAFSPIKAILTDTANNYPVNNYSHFDLSINEFNSGFPYNLFIEFKHKIDTDTLHDGGYITISYDNGNTWMNIINDTVYPEVHPGNDYYLPNTLYSTTDTLFNGEYGFSGKTNGWDTIRFTWHCLPVKKGYGDIGDSMLLRFNFVSDNIASNKDGWMIDDIRLYTVDLGSGIKETNTLDFDIYPNPIFTKAIVDIDKYKEAIISVFDISGRLINKHTYHNNQSITIDRKGLKSGVYFIKIETDDNKTGVRKMIILD